MRRFVRLGIPIFGAAALVLGTLAAAVVAPSASATTHRAARYGAPHVSVTNVRNVSGISPWDGLDCNATNGGTTDTLYVGEPDIAVNPKNPLDQVASWMDMYRDNIDTAYTTDGGATWHRSIPMGLNDCSGGTFNPAIEGAYDTTVSFAPNGTAYLSSMEDEHFELPPTSEYEEWTDISRSVDGGADWSAPVLVPNPLSADDKDMVFADQERPGDVYATFVNAGYGLPAPRGVGELLFSRSTDGGQSFTTTVLASTGSAATSYGNPQLTETSNGTLVLVFSAPTGEIEAMSSSDGGLTWSSPVQVTPALTSPYPTVCGHTVQTRSWNGHPAVINGNTIAIADPYDGPEGTGPGEILLSTSTDDGATWSTSVVLTTPQPILIAQIAGDSHGHLALVYQTVNLSQATCPSTGAVIPASAHVQVSDNLGKTWSAAETIGAPSWNAASQGTAILGGYWLGEYFGVAATGSGFAAVTIQGTPLTRGGPPITGLASVVVSEVSVTGEGRHR